MKITFASTYEICLLHRTTAYYWTTLQSATITEQSYFHYRYQFLYQHYL